MDMSNFEPVDYFQLFFPDQLFETMTMNTNLYARQFLEGRENSTYSRYNMWTETTVAELKAYVSLQIAMGINSKPELPKYWSTYWLTRNLFSDVMSRNRFQLLNAFLHFNDNSTRVARGEPGYDALHKVRPVLNITDPLYPATYVPDSELSIDESMIKFKGRIFFRQYMPAKHTKWGIKMFAICESNTGYGLRFMVYTGKNTFAVDRASVFSMTEQICLQLTSGYEHKGYTLYTDNYYSSPQLFTELKSSGIGACGTVKTNRKYMPNDLQPAVLSLNKGDAPVS